MVDITAAEVFRDFVTDGVPSSGPHNPRKPDIRKLLKQYETIIAAFTASGGVIYASKAALDADLARPANTMAWVLGDAVAANNGIYRKVGASGAGNWVRAGDLPYSFILASNVGDGTPSAIQAATAIPVSGSALILLQIAEDYAGEAATVSFNGAAPLTIKTNSGEDVRNLTGGSVVYGVISGGVFRLANDEAIASLIYVARDEAVAAKDDAETARDIAAGYASDAISGGMDPGLSTVVGMGAITIPAGINHFHVAGYYAAGDGGGALYVKVEDEPVHAGKFQTADGAWWEIAEQQPNIAMFGGGIDGVNRMASFCGYATFPRGGALIEDSVTIDVPMNFQPGAYLSVAAGKTVSLTNTITSPRQWIFRGDGQVIIPLPDEDSGEDVREFPVIWFGAFTQVPGDQAPAIQKAFNALGNSREGKVIFDHGSYDISTGMTVYRGTEVRGSKTRSTVFQIRNDGYAVFQTGNTACFFKDIQFEHHTDVAVKTRTFPFIHVKHDFCEIENVFHQSAQNAIIVDGPNCKIRNVEGVYGGTFPPNPGSAQILIRHTSVSAKGIYCRFSSGAWPDYIIRIGTDAGVSVTAFDIDGVEYIGGSCGVFIHSNGNAVARGMVRGVNARGVSGTQPQVIKLQTDGDGEIFSIPITDIIIPNTATAGVTFQQNSSKSIRRISLNDIQDAAVPGNCVEFIQAAGAITDITLGAAIDTPRANDVVATMANPGGVTAIKVAIPGRRKGKVSGWTVPASGIDDGVTYHLQGASADVHLPNAGVAGHVVMSFKVASSNGFNLVADGGATINGLTSLAVGGNQMVTVAATRNAGNCQYFTQA